MDGSLSYFEFVVKYISQCMRLKNIFYLICKDHSTFIQKNFYRNFGQYYP